MTEPDQYLLGYSEAEQDRFERQALELADDSASLFRQVGLASGQSVVEIGCGPRGCLDMRADAVGPTGSVIGVERSEDVVGLGIITYAGHGCQAGDRHRDAHPTQADPLDRGPIMHNARRTAEVAAAQV